LPALPFGHKHTHPGAHAHPDSARIRRLNAHEY